MMEEDVFLKIYFCEEKKAYCIKVSKDCLASLLDGNVGDTKLKPLLVYHLQNSQPLKEWNKA
jgi:hypothetical protein